MLKSSLYDRLFAKLIPVLDDESFSNNLVSVLESDKILKELFLHQERLDFTCRFKWTENAVAIWDNRSTQHQGLTDFFPYRGLGFERVMDRIAIEGDHPQ